MAKFTVYFPTGGEIGVTVEADDYEAAIDEAYENLPGNICAQCSGWRQSWTRSEGEGWEASAVFDEDGREVWTDRPAVSS